MELVIALAEGPCSDMGPTLISEILEEDHNVKVSSETVRNWLTEAEVWEPKAEKPKHRRSRPRRSCAGELVQMDTCEHHWFGDDEPLVQLIAMVDDATQKVHMRFYSTDSTETNMHCILGYIGSYGLPRAIYTDRATHFHFTPPEKADRGDRKTRPAEVETQIERALRECGIKHIKAHSPEGKGRVERMFKTLQHRLFRRMKHEGITDIKEANEYLKRVYIPKWDKRFGKKPANDFDAHMAVGDLNLKSIFSIQETRVVNNSYTVSYHGMKLQIEAASALPGLKKGRVVVEWRLGGELKIRYKGEYLYMHEILRK
jgi:hypothetical protein